MGRMTERLVLLLFAVFSLAYTSYQINRYINTPYATEPAMNFSTADSVWASGIIIRDEQVIREQINGVISYQCDDGTKVNDTTPIGEVYTNTQDAKIQKRIYSLDLEIAQLMEAGDTVAAEYTNAEILSRQITATVSEIVNSTAEGMVEDLDEKSAELALLLNRNQVVTGAESSFDARIAKLTSQRGDLKSQLGSEYTSFYSPTPGYFVRTIDGYENTLTPQFVEDLTVAQLEEYTQKKIVNSDEAVGKIIRDHNWYYAALVSKVESEKFVVGDKVTLNFNLFNLDNIPFYIEEVQLDKASGGKCIVILRSNYVLPELTAVRNPSANIIFKAYSGLRIPTSARRYEGQTPGVYVLESKVVRFKTINIVYENEDYILCGANTDTKRPLKLFDQVVVEGSDLYDGKTVK